MGADDARMLVDLSSIVAQCDEEMTTAPQELTQSLAPKSSTPFLSLPVTTTTLALASNCTFFTSCSTPQYSAQAEVQSVDLMPPPSSKRMLVEKTVEVPVETTVERTVERRMEVPVEKIIEVPVERIVERILEVSVERIVEVPVDRIVSVEVPVDRIVEVPVDRIVEVPVERIVSVEVPVDRIVEVTMERIVEHSVEVPVDRIIEIPVERIIQLPVERILERHVEVPVDRIVERHIEVPVEMCAVPVGRKRKLRRVEIEAPVAPSTPPSHTLSVPHILWENDSDVPLPLTEQPAVHDERQRLLTDMWKTACLASSAAFTTSTSSSSTASSSPAAFGAFSAVAFVWVLKLLLLLLLLLLRRFQVIPRMLCLLKLTGVLFFALSTQSIWVLLKSDASRFGMVGIHWREGMCTVSLAYSTVRSRSYGSKLNTKLTAKRTSPKMVMCILIQARLLPLLPKPLVVA